MGERLKIFVFVAILGFFGGMIASLAGTYAVPWLASVLPAVLSAQYLLAGIAGACLTLVLVSVWAYVTGPQEH
jgi:hypothetical protein